MEWRMPRILRLIRLYRQHECLWNFTCAEYKRIDLRKQAWTEIAHEFGIEVEEAKTKLKNLRTSYVAEKKKVTLSKQTCKSKDSVYEPHLFYYHEMDFLDSVVILRTTGNQGNSSYDENTTLPTNTVEERLTITKDRKDDIQRQIKQLVEQESEAEPRLTSNSDVIYNNPNVLHRSSYSYKNDGETSLESEYEREPSDLSISGDDEVQPPLKKPHLSNFESYHQQHSQRLKRQAKPRYQWLGDQIVYTVNVMKNEKLIDATIFKIQKILHEAKSQDRKLRKYQLSRTTPSSTQQTPNNYSDDFEFECVELC